MLDEGEEGVVQSRGEECIVRNLGIDWVETLGRKVMILAGIMASGGIPGGEVEGVNSWVPVGPIPFV